MERVTNYPNRPNDVQDNFITHLNIEKKRGDFLNRFAYGLLTTSEKTFLFIRPPGLPVTFDRSVSQISALQAIRQELPAILENTFAFSISAIQSLCEEAITEFPTDFAAAQLISLIYDIAYESRFRSKESFEISESIKEPLKDGLSPIFDLERDKDDFSSFVHRLNDREYMRNVVGKADPDALTIAISYKHMPHPVEKLSSAHLEEIATSVPYLATELGFTRVQIWIDRILSAKNLEGDRSWWKLGLAPFLELPVLYVSGEDREDETLLQEMNTMWINIERVAACIGRGMMSYGKRFNLKLLALDGIHFANSRISKFDWWIHDNIGGGLEEKFNTLLFAMGNTTMLRRETYFEEDRDQLLREGRNVFCEASRVVRVSPVSSSVMRDGVLWTRREGATWLGVQEWCVNFEPGDSEGEGGKISDAIEGISGEEQWEWRSFEIEDEEQTNHLWLMVCPSRFEPNVALAMQMIGEEEYAVGLRATVVVDNPIDFLAFSKSPIRGTEGITRYGKEAEDYLRTSGVLGDGEKLIAIAPIEDDDEVYTKTLI